VTKFGGGEKKRVDLRPENVLSSLLASLSGSGSGDGHAGDVPLYPPVLPTPYWLGKRLEKGEQDTVKREDSRAKGGESVCSSHLLVGWNKEYESYM
jgi:hypothetical protein